MPHRRAPHVLSNVNGHHATDQAPRPNQETTPQATTPVICIVDNTGTIDACRQLLTALPSTTGFAVIAQLDIQPGRWASAFSELSASATMPIHDVVDSVRAGANEILIFPSHREIEF